MSLSCSKRLAYSILEIALKRKEDINVLPHVYIWLVFMLHIQGSDKAARLLENEFPWEPLVVMLNSLISSLANKRFESEKLSVPEKGIGRLLPEDYTLRGLDWSRLYFSEHWFEDLPADDKERLTESSSVDNARVERILSLGKRIAAVSLPIHHLKVTFTPLSI